MLTVPHLGMSRNRCGSMFPYAAVMQRSGCRAVSVSRKAGSRAEAGDRSLQSSPSSDTVASTGVGTGVLLLPRPRGLPG